MNKCRYTLKDVADHCISGWVEAISAMTDRPETLAEAELMARDNGHHDRYVEFDRCPAELEAELTAIADRDGWRFSIDGTEYTIGNN